VACAVGVDDGAGGGMIELPCKACAQALARHSLYLARGTGLDHYAEADSLLAEVDADVVPGLAPSVEIGFATHRPPIYHAREGMPTRDAASTSPRITLPRRIDTWE
jgi:hypothetical protein